MTEYKIEHTEPRTNRGINTNSVKSFTVNGKEYVSHEDFFYDPDDHLETLNSTTHVLGVKIRYFKPWHKKLMPPKRFWIYWIISFALLRLLWF